MSKTAGGERATLTLTGLNLLANTKAEIVLGVLVYSLGYGVGAHSAG